MVLPQNSDMQLFESFLTWQDSQTVYQSPHSWMRLSWRTFSFIPRAIHLQMTHLMAWPLMIEANPLPFVLYKLYPIFLNMFIIIHPPDLSPPDSFQLIISSECF